MTDPQQSPPDLALCANAREHFLSLVDAIRPDLHRYASRLVGSAIDGEDVVQDTLAKAFYALSQSPEVPSLRPWLFRIAKNTAIDLLRRYDRTHVESLSGTESMTNDDFASDPAVLRAALSAFMTLPVSQRSAVILKDVLGESLQEIAEHLNTSVEAVKALLVRGRHNLKAYVAAEPPMVPAQDESARHHALMSQYVTLFNERNWPGVQALLLEECRLDLVSKSQRQGKSVGGYFGHYAQERDLTLWTGRCEGRPCVGVFRRDAKAPEYIILLESVEGRVSFIKDFRYVPYIASELVFVPDDPR